MEAKDTVMNDKQIQLLGQGYEEADHSCGGVSLNEYLLTAQANISFKAGQKNRLYDVIDFIHYWNRGMEELAEWRAQLKEWGIDGNSN